MNGFQTTEPDTEKITSSAFLSFTFQVLEKFMYELIFWYILLSILFVKQDVKKKQVTNTCVFSQEVWHSWFHILIQVILNVCEFTCVIEALLFDLLIS